MQIFLFYFANFESLQACRKYRLTVDILIKPQRLTCFIQLKRQIPQVIYPKPFGEVLSLKIRFET